MDLLESFEEQDQIVALLKWQLAETANLIEICATAQLFHAALKVALYLIAIAGNMQIALVKEVLSLRYQ